MRRAASINKQNRKPDGAKLGKQYKKSKNAARPILRTRPNVHISRCHTDKDRAEDIIGEFKYPKKPGCRKEKLPCGDAYTIAIGTNGNRGKTTTSNKRYKQLKEPPRSQSTAYQIELGNLLTWGSLGNNASERKGRAVVYRKYINGVREA